MYKEKAPPADQSKDAIPRHSSAKTRPSAPGDLESESINLGQRSSSDVTLPPNPSPGKPPSNVQKRRAKVWSNNQPVATEVVVTEVEDGRKRVTRSKSIVNILKIHASMSSIPNAVDGEEMEINVEPQRSGSDLSLAQGQQNGDGDVDKTESGPAPVQRRLTKSFTSDSVIFQESNASENGTIIESDCLAADHPLMKRYQQAVKDHLLQQKEQLRTELKQSDETLKRKQREYEKTGREAYAVGQDLEKLRRTIGQKDEEFEAVNQERLSYEVQVAPLLEQITALKSMLEELGNVEKSTNNELRRLNAQISEALSDAAITNHMTIAKNAVKKAQQDLVVIEQEKTKQESVTARLLDTATKKEAEFKQIEMEIKSMAAEVAEKKDRLTVLNAETQSISMEKRNLLQRWNATLKGMKRRDEDFAEMQNALKNHQQTTTRIEGELSALAKVYTSVRESNDRLIGTLVRLQDEADRCTKTITETQAKSGGMEADIAVCQQALDEMTQQKNSMHKEKVALTNNLSTLTTKLRVESNEIAKLEDSTTIFNSTVQKGDIKMVEAVKQFERMRNANRETEKLCSELEASLEKETLIWTEVDLAVQALKKSCEEYKELMDQTRINSDRALQELEKQTSTVNKKQLQIDGVLKKLDIEKRSSNVDVLLAGKLNSLRYESESAQKNSNSCDERVSKLQKDWMKLQDQLIRASETFERENAAINAILTAQTELEQTKIRLQGEIAINEDEENQLKRKIDKMHVQIAKLNDLITKKLGAKANLENDHLATRGHFATMLRDAELECIQLEEKLGKKLKEKQDLEGALQEAGRQMHFWEQKTAEAKSARDAVVSGQDDEEFNRMVADVHRMQMRLGQLAKQQGCTVKEMEKAVSKRNLILQKGEAVTAAKTIQLTQAQLNRVVIDLRRKVKQFQRDLEAAEREEEESRMAAEASQAAVDGKMGVETEAVQKRTQLMSEIGELSAIHFKNSNLLAAQQMRHKRLEDAREGRYEPFCKDPSAMEIKTKQEIEKRELMMTLVQNIGSTHPHLGDSLKKIEKMSTIRKLRGLLPVFKKGGETEVAMLNKVREKLLEAANVKFRFVDGFQLTALGPPLEESASGVVVAIVGFDRPVLKEEHEQLQATYRAKVSLKQAQDQDPKSTINLGNFVHEFASKYCKRALILNPGHFFPSTRVPAPNLVEFCAKYNRDNNAGPEVPKKSQIDGIICDALKNGQFAIEIDCWLNFPFQSIMKLLEKKLQRELTIHECRRTQLGPWTIDKCLSEELHKGSPSLDTFMATFRQARIMHRSVIENCLTMDAKREIYDARVSR